MAISTSVSFSTFLSSETVSFPKPSLSSKPLQLLSNARVSRTTTTTTTVVSCTTSSSEATAATGKRGPRGIMKPRRVSNEMAELVGTPEISRTEVLKRIWAHIKDNNLQDPNNKKIIICDAKLKKIFEGRDQVGFLEIAGLISPHFLKNEP